MSADDPYRHTLVRAAELLGGAQALCDRLRVPMSAMTRWVAGEGRPPMGIFLQVVDLIAEERDRPQLNPPAPPPRREPDSESET